MKALQWENAQKQNTAEAYKAFHMQYPNSENADEILALAVLLAYRAPSRALGSSTRREFAVIA